MEVEKIVWLCRSGIHRRGRLDAYEAPTGWVRLVATGGTKEHAVDFSVQSGGTMQLVTPFISTSQNNLKISPMTEIAASVMASNVKKGMTLADAFSAGMRTMLQLDAANLVMLQDTSVYLNVLKGAIKSDNRYYDAQSLDGKRPPNTVLNQLSRYWKMPSYRWEAECC